MASTVTYDSATFTYDSLGTDYDGEELGIAEVSPNIMKISKKRHKRVEDYLGVGNALIHR